MRKVRYLLTLAYKDARGAAWKLLFFVLAIVFGVAAVTGTRMLKANLAAHIDHKARGLLGADLSLSSRGPLPPVVEKSLEGRSFERADEVRFRSVVHLEGSGRSKLLQVRAFSGPFPLYGEVASNPAASWGALQRGERGALVSQRIAEQLGVKVGEVLVLSGITLPLLGIVEEGLIEGGGAAFFAPPLYVHRSVIPEELLTGRGSIADYRLYLRFTSPSDVETYLRTSRADLEQAGVSITTVEDRKELLGGIATSLSRYFGIAGLISLLIGMLGAGTALGLYLRSKVRIMALLRSVGATRRDIVLVYSVQIAILGVVASLLGALAGGFAQSAAGSLISHYFGGGVEFTFVGSELIVGVLLGLASLFLVAWPTLRSSTSVPPLAVLREGQTLRVSTINLVWATSLFLAFVWSLATLLLEDGRRALGATAILLVVGLALALLALLLRRTARWGARLINAFSFRFGVASLYRPENQTTAVVVVLGVLAVLLNTVAITRALIDNQIAVVHGTNRPTTYLFDIQTDQREGLHEVLRRLELPVLQEVPVVLMRLAAVKGRRTSELLADPASKIPDWTLKRDYWTSYRSWQADNETVIEGKWVERVEPQQDLVPISVEDRLMERLGVAVGDQLEWDLQGLPLKTFIASKRDIMWERLERNSFIIFPDGVLEDAPQYRFIATRAEDPAVASALTRELSERFPNISVIDVGSIVETVQRLLSQIGSAMRFLFVFIAGAGVLVLFSSVLSSARARIRDGVLLRTIGASSGLIRRSILVEYALLGFLAAVAALPLSLAVGWVLATTLLKVPFVLPGATLLKISAGIFVATLIPASLAGRRVLRQSCAAMLREEA